MKSLIVLAHGSRRATANEEVAALAARLGESGSFETVRAAFLELAEPSFAAVVAELVGSGAQEVVVLPFFLNRGRHVMTDVPALVDAASAAHPGLDIHTLVHIGASEAFFEAVRAHALNDAL